MRGAQDTVSWNKKIKEKKKNLFNIAHKGRECGPMELTKACVCVASDNSKETSIWESTFLFTHNNWG